MMFGSVRKSMFRRSISSSSGSNTSDEIKNLDISILREEVRNCEEYDLEQKIELEIKMQEGTNKLLTACRYQLQALEAAKSLLTSTERMNAYVFELQRRKSLKKMRDPNPHIDNRLHQPLTYACKGKVAVSDIRMPLIWKDSDHFKNRGDCRRFAVFCLLKLGTDVQDTSMISNVDRSMTDMAFDDVIVFNNVSHDFEFRLEVYSYVQQEDVGIASASNKLKKKITYSVSKAIGKKLTANMKEDIAYKGSVPGLELAAHATLRLEDGHPRIKTHDLVTESAEKNRHKLPLFGHFCCRMAVQPQCMVEESYTGYLSLVQQIGNLTGSRRMWSMLKNFSLCMYNSSDVNSSKPDIVIPVVEGTKACSEENANAYPRYTFRISNALNGETGEFLLAADTATELSNWLNYIHQHMEDHALWRPATGSVIDMPSPNLRRQSHYAKNRNSTLYDETPFLEGTASPSAVYSNPHYESDRFPRMSTPLFWSSSSSSSTSNSTENSQSRPKSMLLTHASLRCRQ